MSHTDTSYTAAEVTALPQNVNVYIITIITGSVRQTNYSKFLDAYTQFVLGLRSA